MHALKETNQNRQASSGHSDQSKQASGISKIRDTGSFRPKINSIRDTQTSPHPNRASFTEYKVTGNENVRVLSIKESQELRRGRGRLMTGDLQAFLACFQHPAWVCYAGKPIENAVNYLNIKCVFNNVQLSNRNLFYSSLLPLVDRDVTFLR